MENLTDCFDESDRFACTWSVNIPMSERQHMNRIATYGPKTTNGTLPGGILRIAATVSSCSGSSPTSRLKGVISSICCCVIGLLRLICSGPGNSNLLGLFVFVTTACMRRRERRFKTNRTSNDVPRYVLKLSSNRRPTYVS
jgi:hypothetical protein